jgi:zinc-binding in reverse transcriptase
MLKRAWTGPAQCPFCPGMESVDHIFFTCPLSSGLWSVLSHLHPSGSLLPLNSIQDIWQVCSKLPLRNMLFWGSMLAAVIWSIWSHRNNIIFRDSGAISSNSLYFSICHLFTTWTDLTALPLQVATDPNRGSVAAVSGRGQAADGAIGLSDLNNAGLDRNREQHSDEDLLD